MIILGVRTGIAHDSAACVVRDGELVAMVEEERFVRIKRAPHLAPVHAVNWCLQATGISYEDVDAVASADDPSLNKEASVFYTDALSRLLRHDSLLGRHNPEVLYVPHHMSHAAASYYASGFDDAAIITVDGQGETVSTVLAHGKGGTIEVLQSFDVSQSIGYFYSAVSRFLGLGHDSAGKLMGLASYGEPRYSLPWIHLSPDGYRMDIKAPPGIAPNRLSPAIRTQWLRHLSELGGPLAPLRYTINPVEGRLRGNLEPTERHKDIAASAQRVVEDLMLHLVRLVVQQTGSRKLVLGGGVALNCSANGVIRRSGLVDDMYIFPAAHDAGGALGAALYVAAQRGEPACPPLDHPYWGPEFDHATLERTLAKVGVTARCHDDVGSATAELLSQGAIVGWLQGRMEVGPRALGHRSVLADPTRVENFARVNRIKGREAWRPLAPSVTESAGRSLVEHYVHSPFMLEAFQVREDVRSLIPAVTHVDGSTRLQSVGAATSPHYRRLLQGMEERVGVAAVMNTSFNGPTEPIVCGPLDALRTFFSTELDALVMGSYIVEKRGGSASGFRSRAGGADRWSAEHACL